MKNLEEIKMEIPNLYGGDTEYLNKYKNELKDLAKKYTIPEIVSILFHHYNIMTTPDSLGSYYKLILKMVVSRKKKSLLINDEEYQIALDERARVNGANYAYYSKSAREKKRLTNKYKDAIGGISKQKSLQHIISTKSFSEEKLEKLKQEKERLTKQFISEFNGKKITDAINNGVITMMSDDYLKLAGKLNKITREINIMYAIKLLADAVDTKMDQITVIYNDEL